MESLSLASPQIGINSCRSAHNLGNPVEYRQIRQVGFACSRRRRGKCGSLLVRSRRRVITNDTNGGLQSSQDGSSMVEEEKLVLGSEMDSTFSSPVLFQPIFESGESETVSFSGGKAIDDPTELKEGEEEQEAREHDQEQENKNDEEGKIKAIVSRSIVFVTSEAAPYSKTGGLGDVTGSLPIALAARGHRVMVVSPRYLRGTPEDKIYAGALDADCRIKIQCFGGEQEVSFFHEYRAGVDWVFVDHPSYHRPGNPYGDSFGAFGDNQFRFALLCHAACEAPLMLPLGGYTYGEKCMFLVNDWHAGLVPVLLAAKYRPHGVYKDARSILVIHNISHQGVEPALTYSNLGLPPEWYGALEWVFPTWARTHALDAGEAVNVLKGAIVTADRILTVSQGYAWEITTIEGGYGLDNILADRKFVLSGITNGIDIAEWDPSSDVHIAAHYSVDDLSGKVQCKIALQKELGLPQRPDCPLIGFIGRLDYQKGIDLIQSANPELMQDDVQLVMLGSGGKQYEEWMKTAESLYRDKFRGWVGFNVPISHRITAGCDILLMPSRFEPCGLNQLYAMRYGTVPVVHCTGGLRDTVENFNPYACEGEGAGTGWTFSPLTAESMIACLRTSIRTYREYKSSWEGLMKRGMKRDYSWENAALQYEQVFEWAFIDPPYVRYACIAHKTTIIYEFNSVDSSLQTLAHQCLHQAPQNHSIFSHTTRNRSFTFLIDDPFIFFAITDHNLDNQDRIRFLNRLKEALDNLTATGDNNNNKSRNADGASFSSYCFQGELHPVVHRLISKRFDLDDSNKEKSRSSYGSRPSSVSGSSKGGSSRRVLSAPVLVNLGEGLKKKRKLFGELGGGENKELFDFPNGGGGGQIVSREVVVCHKAGAGGLSLAGDGGRQRAKRIWEKHVWVVLLLDLAVCLVLFGIWLWICQGFQCIRG
ncbi:Pentafunctional AROM polypeptide [Dionaea muscipula]